jgi:hypothetical protein
VSAAAGTYFKIANNGTDDLKIYSMQVETASDEISEFVTYIAGKSTGDATTGVTDTTTCATNYKAAKQMILYMSAARDHRLQSQHRCRRRYGQNPLCQLVHGQWRCFALEWHDCWRIG